MVKNDEYYTLKTLDEINLIIKYADGLTVDDFQQQPAVLDGIVFRMIQMSEHMNSISEEFKLQHPDVKWVNIKGFRNRLVHNYGGVNLDFVYNAISIDIPELKLLLTNIIDHEFKNK